MERILSKLYFYYSAMNAGKSTTLLQSSHNYNERGMDTLLFIPSVDDRDGVGRIGTRVGLSSEAAVVDKQTNLFERIKQAISENLNIRCILIDEAQFLTAEQVDQLGLVVDELNLPVLCYGLRTDFQGKVFPGSQSLLASADNLVEIKTICHCGRKAIMNMRIDEFGAKVKSGDQIAIGGNDLYVAVCRRHFRLGDAGRGFERSCESLEMASSAVD